MQERNVRVQMHALMLWLSSNHMHVLLSVHSTSTAAAAPSRHSPAQKAGSAVGQHRGQHHHAQMPAGATDRVRGLHGKGQCG